MDDPCQYSDEVSEKGHEAMTLAKSMIIATAILLLGSGCSGKKTREGVSLGM